MPAVWGTHSKRRYEYRCGKQECSRHDVAHALVRAVSTLVSRPWPSCCGLFLFAITAFAQPLDLIVRNARIWTGDAKKPWADSLAVSGDLVTAVGAVQGTAPKVIDAGGRLITPGFIDSHVHMLDGGLRLTSVQLRDARTKPEFIDRIRKFAATVPEGAWIIGGDWDHEQWGGELPTRAWIDSVTPKHPVWVHRLDGHMALANSVAIQIARVTRRTPNVDGGTIVRDSQGEPSGVFKDNAMEMIESHRSALTLQDVIKALEAAQQYLLPFGVTTVHNMGGILETDALEQIRTSGRLKIRVYAGVPIAHVGHIKGRMIAGERGDRWLRIGLMKGFLDGSLGSHTAAFHEPYTDAPKDRGLLVTTPEDIRMRITPSHNVGVQVAIHAIGDRANTLLLDVYEWLAKVYGPMGFRWRIEHAQHLRAEDIPRMAKLGVVASMQPYHAIDDGRWADKVIGPLRAKMTYAFRSLLDAKVNLAFGSDWFVAPANVMEGIYAAVTRRTLDGKHPNGWVPEQKITVEEALRAYTYGGAFAGYEENYKGTLTPGKLADFVMLDRDITKIPPTQIKDVKVLMTVVGGKVAYDRSAH